MSKRIDITNQIFNDIYVLKFERKKNTHAEYKCLCMLCNETLYVTYSNLKSGNTKHCQKCGQKKTNYVQELDIMKRLLDGESIAVISRDLELSRGVVYRVRKEWQNYSNKLAIKSTEELYTFIESKKEPLNDETVYLSEKKQHQHTFQ